MSKKIVSAKWEECTVSTKQVNSYKQHAGAATSPELPIGLSQSTGLMAGAAADAEALAAEGEAE